MASAVRRVPAWNRVHTAFIIYHDERNPQECDRSCCAQSLCLVSLFGDLARIVLVCLLQWVQFRFLTLVTHHARRGLWIEQ